MRRRVGWFENIIGRRRHKSQQLKKKKTERFSHSLSHSKSQNERMRQAKTLEIFSGVQDVKFINLRLALHMAIIKLDVDKVNLKMESITQMNTCTIRRCSFV